MDEAEVIVRDAARKNKVQAPPVIFKQSEVRSSLSRLIDSIDHMSIVQCPLTLNLTLNVFPVFDDIRN